MKRPSFSRAALATVLAVGLLHWITSCRTNTPLQSPTGQNGVNPQAGPGGSGEPGACDTAPDPNDCFLERAMLIEELLGNLYELEDARDKRSVPAALDALDTGEPDVQIQALRVLGPFASEPGVGPKVLPWLLADDYRREEGAAAVLRETRDPGLTRLGEQFRSGHQGDNAAPPLAGWWRDPKPHGFEAYPGAKRFPPGDSLRSIGLLTDDPVERVRARYAVGPSAKTLDLAGYQAKLQEMATHKQKQVMDAFQNPEFVQRQKDIQALVDEYQKTHDPKLIEKIQKLSSELKPPSIPTTDTDGALELPLPPPTNDGPLKDGRFVVLDERDGVPTRVVIAYPEPAVGKTVVILGWSPTLFGGPPDRRKVQLH